MPGFHHPVPRPLGGDGKAVKLAGKPDREVAYVDHFLDLATAFGEDLSAFMADQAAEPVFLFAENLPENPNQLASARRRDHPPGKEGVVGAADRGGDAVRPGRGDPPDDGAVDRRTRDEVAGRDIDAEPREEVAAAHLRRAASASAAAGLRTLAAPMKKAKTSRGISGAGASLR